MVGTSESKEVAEVAVTIKNPDNCTACASCVEACPMGVLAVEDAVQIVSVDDCVSCGLCVDACPAEVLEVE